MTPPGLPSVLAANTAWLSQDGAERRQVTVAFIDMVGSSRLTARLGAEEMSELIVAYRRAAGAAIEAHGGYIARMLGDGILAYWGFPRAREDDAARALAGCLAVLEAMEAVNATGLAGGQRVSVRIGLDTGIVVVGRLGVADPRGEADIVGDAPNLAAQLQKAADPDTIVTTEAVRALAGTRFAFEPAGEMEHPALGGRIPLFRVLGPIPGAGRTRPLRTGRLYGREEEQARLDRAWREAYGGRGRAIVLIGEAGIGKSALLGHLRRTVGATGGLWHAAFCQPESAASPLLPVRDLVRSLCGTEDAARLAAMAGRDGEEGEGLALLARLLDSGRGSERAGTAAALAGAAQRPRRLAAGLCGLVRLVAPNRPLALVVEDAHWADDASRAVLSALAEGLHGLPVLLALSAREDGFSPPAGPGEEAMLRLAPLSQAAMAGLIAALDAEGALDPAARALISERAEGNPLFAEELVQLAREAGSGTRATEILSRASSLADSLLARLDALGDARPVAQVASVIGREFALPLLARVLEVERGAVSAAVARLIQAGLVIEAERDRYAFRHALVRDAAYASLLKARRRTVHARVGSILLTEFGSLVERRPELPAQHLEAAGETDAAILWWTKAGERAALASAHADALRLYRHAETLLRGLPGGERSRRRADLLIRIGAQVLAVQGNAADELEAAYAEAVSILQALGEGEGEAMFAALWGLTTFALVKGDIPRALTIGERMRTIARDEDRLLQVHRLLGLANLLRGDHAHAEAEYGAVLARYDEARHEHHRFAYGSDPAAVVRAHLAWGRMIAGRFSASEESAAEAEAQARRIAHPHTLAHVLAVDSLRCLIGRNPAAAAARAEEVQNLSARHGFPYWTAWCGVIAAAAKPLAAAERARALEEAIAAYRATGAQQLVPYGLALAAEARLAEGRPHAALAHLAEAARLAAATGVALYSDEIARLACLARRGAGLPAEESLEAVAERAAARGAGLWALRALVDAAAPRSRLIALLEALGGDDTAARRADLDLALRALAAA